MLATQSYARPAVASAAACRVPRGSSEGFFLFFSRSCHVTRFCYCSEIKCDAARSIDAAAAAGLVDSTHGEPMHAAAQRSVSRSMRSPRTYHSRHRHVAGRPGDVAWSGLLLVTYVGPIHATSCLNHAYVMSSLSAPATCTPSVAKE
jgi:hypothetical protein